MGKMAEILDEDKKERKGRCYPPFCVVHRYAAGSQPAVDGKPDLVTKPVTGTSAVPNKIIN